MNSLGRDRPRVAGHWTARLDGCVNRAVSFVEKRHGLRIGDLTEWNQPVIWTCSNVDRNQARDIECIRIDYRCVIGVVFDGDRSDPVLARIWAACIRWFHIVRQRNRHFEICR